LVGASAMTNGCDLGQMFDHRCDSFATGPPWPSACDLLHLNT
jgi:hypothetical protein